MYMYTHHMYTHHMYTHHMYTHHMYTHHMYTHQIRQLERAGYNSVVLLNAARCVCCRVLLAIFSR